MTFILQAWREAEEALDRWKSRVSFTGYVEQILLVDSIIARWRIASPLR